MKLAVGTHLGPYEILAPVGAGGMGEVYRARDMRLGRDVAVKVLPTSLSADPDRLRRFEQEARSAGVLNHPGILQVYDLGTHDGSPYLVTELLEGETLRERFHAGPIPARKACDYAIQMARALAAAHEKGIIHRDLKPENLFLTRDGRVKVLDFGLAKLTQSEGRPEAATSAPTSPPDTSPGVVLGTVGYMSPEQVRGLPADHRSDIFSLGTILYEMLSGKRAFKGDSSVETLNAILKEDPAELSTTDSAIPSSLERIVRRCLEKNPEERFQSARDVAFSLEALSAPSGSSAAVAAVVPSLRRQRLVGALAGLAFLVAIASGSFIIGKRAGRTPSPVFHQLTFRRGAVLSAKFAPDGRTIIYGATWDGNPFRIYSVRPESPESRTLELPEGDVFAISKTGEMAISIGHHFTGGFISMGTLARTPLGGGAPREILENVQQADWAPSGKDLAIVREVEGRARLEFPIGKVLFDTAGWISDPRVSPKGDLVAFMDHPVQGDDGGSVAVADLEGKVKTLSASWLSEGGTAWAPSGEEIWFTATRTGGHRELYAVTLSGRERLVARVPGRLTLYDISRDGRVLFGRSSDRLGISLLQTGEKKERDLSWLDWSLVRDISDDGKTILFDETGEGGGATYAVYLRKTDGSPAVRLGDGIAMALSPDGKWAISFSTVGSQRQLVLLPTGPGEPKPLRRGPIENYHWATWFPDGKRILVLGNEAGRGRRGYIQDLGGGDPRAITPEGVGSFLGAHAISPDAKSFVTADPSGKIAVYPLEGGESRVIPGLESRDRVIRWTVDGKSIYVSRRGDLPARVYRVEVATGRKQLWKELAPADPAGLFAVASVQMTPDGHSLVYSYARTLSELFLAEELE